MKIDRRTRFRMSKSNIKFFFLRLFGKVSIFKGFDIHEGESVKLRRNRKYLQIDSCFCQGGGDLPCIDIVK